MDIPLEPRDSDDFAWDPAFLPKTGKKNLDLRVSATPPSRWTITPLYTLSDPRETSGPR